MGELESHIKTIPTEYIYNGERISVDNRPDFYQIIDIESDESNTSKPHACFNITNVTNNISIIEYCISTITSFESCRNGCEGDQITLLLSSIYLTVKEDQDEGPDFNKWWLVLIIGTVVLALIIILLTLTVRAKKNIRYHLQRYRAQVFCCFHPDETD